MVSSGGDHRYGYIYEVDVVARTSLNRGSKLSVISPEGRVITSNSVESESVELSLGHFNTGLYVLWVNNITIKFIKNE
jgi:hypothetical protein